MSSPNINNVIVFGIIVAYACVVLLGTDASLVDEEKLLVICKVCVYQVA